ncbi:MAG: HigA family addiction module antidote protein [Erysipelotrichaceae bacterium]|nr:HigA family addiction module antidote protein [Erysipelotrichaceae bacterium]
MSNYIEYEDMIAFHPGYYIKELVEDSGLTQEDFAKRLGTTPKNLSVIINGEQRLSIEIATKLSRMFGTSVMFWLNLQNTYDEKMAEYLSHEELVKERDVFKFIDYKYFRDNFGLPNLSRKVDEQIKCVRDFLNVSSLTVLEEAKFAVNFRSDRDKLSKSNIINANLMVEIAINKALKIDAPKFNKRKFKKVIPFILSQTKNHDGFLPEVTNALKETGVILVVLPNIKNSGINGATKRVDGKVMLMINDRRHYADTFWFTLFHEIGHVMNNDFGMTIKDSAEDEADLYARNALIPEEPYQLFIKNCEYYNEKIIVEFADSIDQDPGIVLGRLMKDEIIPYSNKRLSANLRHKYTIDVNYA